ncbi:hypothetical protein Ple7327_1008 [Pleurocapsa sp. PCC 7327]|uniref:hypothetical protein n=1 Tax=Pleurocapsa sp. PCC 7327 TaxID=118163 RepID=UPI00029FDE0D|nr:hypothetical protein Ple7327_1008 [Pleurocapsa sp. PCC 7327]
MRNCKMFGFPFCSKQSRWSISFLLGLGLTIGSGMAGWAESRETAPPELKMSMAQIEAAANQKDLKQVMEFYSPDFKNSDGLNYTSLQQSLDRFWKRFNNVQYKTELQSWENTKEGLMAQTLTTVTGTSEQKGRTIQLQSTIQSRQYFRDQKLVRQEILTEKTEVTSGTTPPKVTIVLPETLKVGQEFEFDAIVQEPLENDLLAGTAIDEPVDSKRYLTPGAVELELLSAGGLFKRAKAPDQAGHRWLSAILVRSDGMTMVTQRIKVES